MIAATALLVGLAAGFWTGWNLRGVTEHRRLLSQRLQERARAGMRRAVARPDTIPAKVSTVKIMRSRPTRGSLESADERSSGQQGRV